METNELPEDVKAKIEQYGTEQSVSPSDEYFIKRDVEFGYRLALQSKEEEVTARTMELELRYAQIEHMKEQLKAKDEQNERLREALNIWQEADSLNLEMESSILNTEQRKRVISLLSQSTDKP